MNDYEKLEWLHSQISELIESELIIFLDGVEWVNKLEAMQYFVEDLREPYLKRASDE